MQTLVEHSFITLSHLLPTITTTTVSPTS